MSSPKHYVVLKEEDQDRLRDALAERGEHEIAHAVGVSRVALLRGAAGLGVLRGTRALIVDGLDDLDDDEADDDEPEAEGDESDDQDADDVDDAESDDDEHVDD